MIVSASRRTDIPRYFSEWLLNRIGAGYALTRNPMNANQVRRVSLLQEDVDCFVFWTKDPANMVDKLDTLDEKGYPYYFQFTLTPYGPEIEKNIRAKCDIEDTFIKLSQICGKERIVWRYDPIIINDMFDFAYHTLNFEKMCRKLQGCAESVFISFVDNYAKLKKVGITEIAPEQMRQTAVAFSDIAKEYGLPVNICCEEGDFSACNIAEAACIDKGRVERLIGRELSLKRDRNQRAGCRCCESVDIGAYDTCLSGCIYCYANKSRALIENNIAKHNPKGEFLISKTAQNGRGLV